MFSTFSPKQQKTFKSTVASKYSVYSLQALGLQVNSCTDPFTSTLHELPAQGELIDLGEWLQWYAFDVIDAMTFDKRFEFIEERKNIEGVIEGIGMD